MPHQGGGLRSAGVCVVEKVTSQRAGFLEKSRLDTCCEEDSSSVEPEPTPVKPRKVKIPVRVRKTSVKAATAGSLGGRGA